MNDADQEPQNPARAFEDLRSEVFVLRRGIEDWQKYIDKKIPPNYAEHLNVLAKGLDSLGAQLDGMGKQFNGMDQRIASIQAIPKTALDTLKHEGSELLDESEKRFRVAESQLGAAERNLRNLFDQVVTQREQRWAVIRAGLIGSVVGFVLGLIVIWPSTDDGGLSQWDAGLAHLQKADPIAWNRLTADTNLVEANRARIEACQAAATKSKKDQNCAITVAVPEPPAVELPPPN